MDEINEFTGIICSSMARVPGSSTRALQLPVTKDTTLSIYYENFRATKFNKPPCLYKVISTSFSNDAITWNSFPVLVFKQTKRCVSELQSVTWLRSFVSTSTNYLICCLIFLVLIPTFSLPQTLPILKNMRPLPKS